MRITAYRTYPHVPEIRPASPRRLWMDETYQRFAYRCLPLVIANGWGWELASDCTFEALWTGHQHQSSVKIVRHDEGPEPALPMTHFGEGILTFDTRYVFRTPEGYDMLVTGPLNSRKDGIVPLTGIVETSWLPFTFTMNWAFTRPGVPVRFEKGEPFCQIFPVPRTLVEEVEPEIRDLADNPELKAQHDEWCRSRGEFNRALAQREEEATQQGWQRYYLKGTSAGEERIAHDHRTRVHVRPFVEAPRDGEEGAPEAERAAAASDES